MGKQPEAKSLPGGASQTLAPTREKHRPRMSPAKKPPSWNSGNNGARGQRPAPRSIVGDCERIASPNPVASRGDTSKLTCYTCGQTGGTPHLTRNACNTSDPSSGKSLRLRLRSDGEHPAPEEPLQNDEGAPELKQEEILDEAPGEQAAQEDFPDGSQYEDEQTSYEEYNGYEPLSDYEEPVYIRAMSDSAPINFATSTTWNGNKVTMLLESASSAPHG